MINAGQKIRHCHSARRIIPEDRRWRLQVASCSGGKTRRLSDDVSRGELGPKGGKEETVPGEGAGTGMRMATGKMIGAGTGLRMATGKMIGAGTRPGTGTGTETRTERRVEGRDSPGTYEVIV